MIFPKNLKKTKKMQKKKKGAACKEQAAPQKLSGDELKSSACPVPGGTVAGDGHIAGEGDLQPQFQLVLNGQRRNLEDDVFQVRFQAFAGFTGSECYFAGRQQFAVKLQYQLGIFCGGCGSIADHNGLGIGGNNVQVFLVGFPMINDQIAVGIFNIHQNSLDINHGSHFGMGGLLGSQLIFQVSIFLPQFTDGNVGYQCQKQRSEGIYNSQRCQQELSHGQTSLFIIFHNIIPQNLPKGNPHKKAAQENFLRRDECKIIPQPLPQR